MAPAQSITIPDFERNWLWPRSQNPYLEDVEKECNDRSAKFEAFQPEAQRVFEKCKFNLLAGLSYPWMSREQLNSACELMNLYFVFDDHSDKSTATEVWQQVDVIMDAMRHPQETRPEGEWVGGEIARQFWLNIMKISTNTFQQRFLASWERYLHGVVEEAENRSTSCILDIDGYFRLRRLTVGTRPSFRMVEIDMDIPEEVTEHPTILELELVLTDMVAIVNDVLSYNKEQASGEDEHNLITVIMKERNVGLQEAIDYAGDFHASRVERFYELYLDIPRWGGPVDLDVQRLVQGMAWWETGNIHWSFESERYFGSRGLEVRRAKKVHLLPKMKSNGIGPLAVDDIRL